MFDPFGLIKLREFSKSECEVTEKLENIIEMRSIPGNGRKKDRLGAM